ncbi:MAG TPA: hypothetical protein PKD61_26525 [Polyangiaceae bacterium]|nr:hypothetical protein [Polyangiaceae bacterium]
MSTDSANKTLVAYHEAAHACLAVLQGRPVVSVSIAPADASRGHSDHGKLPEDLDLAYLDEEETEMLVQEIRSLVGGELAVHMFCEKHQHPLPTDAGGAADWNTAIVWADAIAEGDMDVRQTVLDEAQAWTRQALSGNWAGITAVAEALLAEETLPGHRVEVVFRDAMAHTNT